MSQAPTPTIPTRATLYRAVFNDIRACRRVALNEGAHATDSQLATAAVDAFERATAAPSPPHYPHVLEDEATLGVVFVCDADFDTIRALFRGVDITDEFGADYLDAKLAEMRENARIDAENAAADARMTAIEIARVA